MTPDIDKLREFFSTLDLDQLRGVLGTLIDHPPSPEEREYLLKLVKDFLYKYRWQIAFTVVALVLIANPPLLAGFGPSGPVAGSVAASWQSAIGGYVAAGSAFATLQSLGMLYPLLLPALGSVALGTAVGSGLAMNYRKSIVGGFRRAFTTLQVMSTTAAIQLTIGGPLVAMGMSMGMTMVVIGGFRWAMIDVRRRGRQGGS